MKYLLQKSRLEHLIRHRNGYLVLASGSLMLNSLLVIFLFFLIGRERVIVIPPDIQKPFWVTSTQVSPEYLSEMSLFLNSLNLNVSPSNAPIQHNILLRYIDPSNYETLKMQLKEVENRIKKEHITMAFYPAEVKVDTHLLIARIMGDLQYTVGDSQLPLQHVVYQYHFHYQQGRLTLTSFSEVKNHA